MTRIDTTPEEEIIAEFQSDRKRRQRLWGVVVLALVLLWGAVDIFHLDPIILRWAGIALTIVAVVSWLNPNFRLRCPACGASMMTARNQDMNPSFCRECGARLK